MMTLLSDALQSAIYQRLAGDTELGAIVGTEIYDSVPKGPMPKLFVLIGEEQVIDASDVTAHGAMHDLSISVLSTADGFLRLKQTASAIIEALSEPDLTMSRGRVVGLWFKGSQAKRSTAGQRRIDLKFKVRLEA
jgi:hypothetical protein